MSATPVHATRPDTAYWEINEGSVLWVEDMGMYAYVTADDVAGGLVAILLPEVTHPEIAAMLEQSGKSMSFVMPRDETYELVTEKGFYNGSVN